MESWRKGQVELTGSEIDFSSTMILIATVAISSEKLLRDNSLKGHENLDAPFDRKRLAHCNLSSLAAATGLNRELVRRRVSGLQREGLLVRDSQGGVQLAPGVAQSQAVSDVVATQLQVVTRTVDRLMDAGLIRQVSARAEPSGEARQPSRDNGLQESLGT